MAFEDLTSDQQDWDLEIIQALVAPSDAEDAALACAATWLRFGSASQVSVIVFDSMESCIVAEGRIQNARLSINVGSQSSHCSRLLRPGLLFAEDGPCVISDPDIILCWPEHSSAVLVAKSGEDSHASDDLAESISRRLLSRWTVPHTAFAVPEHMDAMAEFCAGAGHEINNPLGSIIGQTQLLLKQEPSAAVSQALETIGSQAWRIRDMIGDAMLFARPPQPEFRSLAVAAIVRQAVEQQRRQWKGTVDRIRLIDAPADVQLTCDDSQIASLLSHLVRNACESVQELDAPRVTIRCETHGGIALSIAVTDNGPELDELTRRHLFDPFYSGRQAGRGLGFGLCHCWQIARMHNGLLSHESVDEGNRFTLLLPTDLI